MESTTIAFGYGDLYPTMDYHTHLASHSSLLSIPSPSFMSSYPSPTTTPSPGPPSPWYPDTPAEEGSRSRATSATPSRTSPSTAVATACLACRGKHLKCDGQAPCGRCRGTTTECVYVASRRGYKGPRRSPTASPPQSQSSSVHSSISSISFSGQPLAAPFTTGPLPMATIDPFMRSTVAASPEPNVHHSSLSGNQKDARSRQHPSCSPTPLHAPSFADRCLDSFYQNFYPTNSFVPPKDHLLRWASRQGGLGHLLAAIQWVGSLYMPCGGAGNRYFEEAYHLTHDGKQAQDAWAVQTLLLLALGLNLTAQQDRARAIFTRAEAAMTQVALSPSPFTTHHSSGNHMMLEECWNRTCWSIFTLGTTLGIQPAEEVTHDAFMIDQPPSAVGFEHFPWSSPQSSQDFGLGLDPALFGSSMTTPGYFGAA